MARSRLLKSARQILERHEQRHAVSLAASERQVREGEAKLAELERYRVGYLRDFDQRAQQGLTAGQALNHQNFIARIVEALNEQREVLARARTHHAEELRKWRSAARRSAALNRIVGRHDLADKQRAEKAEQATADAHAQRTWTDKGNPRGH
ncbi:MAG TPA: flagellar FliJ family protein [Steroidobacteraceae bacterium]|nr:flagellar FliJ family protein [Steroidobacteraceae bacterium]